MNKNTCELSRRTRKIFKRVFRRTKSTNGAEAEEDNLNNFDVAVLGDALPIINNGASTSTVHPQAACVRPLQSQQKMEPRLNDYAPGSRGRRRESPPSDHRRTDASNMSFARALNSDDTTLSIEDVEDVEDEARTPETLAAREARCQADRQQAMENLLGTPLAKTYSFVEPKKIKGGMANRGANPPRQKVEKMGYHCHRRRAGRPTSYQRRSDARRGSRMRSVNEDPFQPGPSRNNNMAMQVPRPRYDIVNEVPKPAIDLGSIKTKSDLIDAAIPNEHRNYRQDWANYVGGYFGGHYNISLPPQPPRRHSQFTYLPALPPDYEKERMKVIVRINPAWTLHQERSALFHIQLAQDRFGAYGGGVSLIQHHFEKLIVEEGYNMDVIKRPESIAAHVVLSTEVLVILDTHKDWRFAGNPLVTHGPKIRFYAGAPLISACGCVIGVFSIFSKEPRDQFNAYDRRVLVNFSTGTMTDSIQDWGRAPEQMGKLIPPGSSLPVSQAEFDLADQNILRAGPEIRPYDYAGADPEVPFFLGPQHPRSGTPDFARLDDWAEQATPPSSGESSPPDQAQVDAVLGRNYLALSLNMPHTNPASNMDVGGLRPDGGSPSPMIYTPRPFDVSDLTSVSNGHNGRGHHGNTPLNFGFGDSNVNGHRGDETNDDREYREDPENTFEDKRRVVDSITSADAAAYYRDYSPAKQQSSQPQAEADAPDYSWYQRTNFDAEMAARYAQFDESASAQQLSYYEGELARPQPKRQVSRALMSYDEPLEGPSGASVMGNERQARRALVSYDEPLERPSGRSTMGNEQRQVKKALMSYDEPLEGPSGRSVMGNEQRQVKKALTFYDEPLEGPSGRSVMGKEKPTERPETPPLLSSKPRHEQRRDDRVRNAWDERWGRSDEPTFERPPSNDFYHNLDDKRYADNLRSEWDRLWGHLRR